MALFFSRLNDLHWLDDLDSLTVMTRLFLLNYNHRFLNLTCVTLLRASTTRTTIMVLVTKDITMLARSHTRNGDVTTSGAMASITCLFYTAKYMGKNFIEYSSDSND